MKAKTLADLLSENPVKDRAKQAFLRGEQLRWTVDWKRYMLQHEVPVYEIDLEELTTPAAMLDWIFQLTTKTWIHELDIACVVEWFGLLLDPQATLCSRGQSKTLTKEQIREKIDRVRAELAALELVEPLRVD